MSIYEIVVRTIDGQEVTLERFRGHILVVVNVASRCACTPQYRGLEALYRRFRDQGVVVLGFPCDQFGGQELATEADIKSFCSTRYSVTFPMFAKIKVNGPDAHPLYRWLKSERPGWFGVQRIGWNFTKFVVDADGRVIARFGPMSSPRRISRFIERMLEKRRPVVSSATQ